MKEYFARVACGAVRALPFLVISGASVPAVAGELRLLMFDQPGCIYCARWEAEIGPVYPSTEEGRIAPLTRIDIHDTLPEDVTLDRPAALTPTFVLLDDGRESGRIEGYPGDEFFWYLLSELIARADLPDG